MAALMELDWIFEFTNFRLKPFDYPETSNGIKGTSHLKWKSLNGDRSLAGFTATSFMHRKMAAGAVCV